MTRAISTSYGTQPFAFEAKMDFREGLKRTKQDFTVGIRYGEEQAV